MMGSIKIIDYQPHHQPYFELFNKNWIEESFELEELDKYVLSNPDEAIIAPGGAVLMALYNDQVAGTVALRKLEEHVYEFTKMAVDPAFRRKGIAEALCYASFDKARALGGKTVILYSNYLQAAAIKLYEKIGFEHLPVTPGVYKRANVKMKIELETIQQQHHQ
jgi:ribosomal protein S18 acetylase RimI-like enzyme